MTNEMKLLLAFIEASGYEVEELTACDEPAYQEAVSQHNTYLASGGNATWPHPEQRDFVNVSGYTVTKKKTEYVPTSQRSRF